MLSLRRSLILALSCSALACVDGSGLDTTSSSSGSASSAADWGETSGGCDISNVTEVSSCAQIIGESFCSEGGSHVDQDSTIDWTNNPPHSGDHYPTWESKGEHETPVMRGNWVHNMEHGAVVLLYNCPNGCDTELEVLRAVVEARGSQVLMTEDSELVGARFAAVSWTWVHEFEAPDMDDLLCFVDQHYDNAPESVP